MHCNDIAARPFATIDFPHGAEVVPTSVDGWPVRFASIDDDGQITVWGTLTPPVIDNGAWSADTEMVQGVGMVGEDDLIIYGMFTESLHRL